MKRSEIKPNPNNPRVISQPARKGLHRVLAKFGIVEPIVWNKRTGHVLGGHQRLSLRDEEAKGADYELTASVVDIQEDDEDALVIALNNPKIQGEYDTEKLTGALQRIPADKMAYTGFDKVDVRAILAIKADFHELPIPDVTIRASDPEAERKKIDSIKEDKKRNKSHGRDRDVGESYLVIVFESPAVMSEVQMMLGAEDRYINGKDFLEFLSGAKSS